MTKNNMRRMTVAWVALLVVAVGLWAWSARTHSPYRLADTEANYTLAWQTLAPITVENLDLTQPEKWEGHVIYQDEDGSIAIEAITQDDHGIYAIYFSLRSTMQKGIHLLAAEKYTYDGAGQRQTQVTALVELGARGQWLPCKIVSLGGYNAQTQTSTLGVNLDHSDFDASQGDLASNPLVQATKEGTIELRLSGVTKNIWQKGGGK